MRALTLHQPYASAIALGCKRIETRGYRTVHRGEIAIHAGLYTPCANAAVLFDAPAPHREAFIAAGYEIAGRVSMLKLPQGCIVAIAEINAVLSVEDLGRGCYLDAAGASILTSEERHWGNYAAGRQGWVLTNIRRLVTPIPARGFQGLWDWPPPADLELHPATPASVPSVSSVGPFL